MKLHFKNAALKLRLAVWCARLDCLTWQPLCDLRYSLMCEYNFVFYCTRMSKCVVSCGKFRLELFFAVIWYPVTQYSFTTCWKYETKMTIYRFYFWNKMLSRIGLDRVDAVLTLGMCSWDVERKKTKILVMSVTSPSVW